MWGSKSKSLKTTGVSVAWMNFAQGAYNWQAPVSEFLFHKVL
jgi:hypothetical protein